MAITIFVHPPDDEYDCIRTSNTVSAIAGGPQTGVVFLTRTTSNEGTDA